MGVRRGRLLPRDAHLLTVPLHSRGYPNQRGQVVGRTYGPSTSLINPQEIFPRAGPQRYTHPLCCLTKAFWSGPPSKHGIERAPSQSWRTSVQVWPQFVNNGRNRRNYVRSRPKVGQDISTNGRNKSHSGQAMTKVDRKRPRRNLDGPDFGRNLVNPAQARIWSK